MCINLYFLIHDEVVKIIKIIITSRLLEVVRRPIFMIHILQFLDLSQSLLSRSIL